MNATWYATTLIRILNIQITVLSLFDGKPEKKGTSLEFLYSTIY